MPVELGSYYRDIASGAIGMATARTEYLNDATPIYRLTPETGPVTALVEVWVPEPRLVPAPQRAAGFGSS